METILLPVQKKTSTPKTKFPTVNYLLVAFNLPLEEKNIRQFREDVLRCIKSNNELEIFSNEVWEDGLFIRNLSKYPLIQYRVYKKQAAIFALQSAVPLLEKFLALYCQPGNSLPFFPNNPCFRLQVIHREKENNFKVLFNEKSKPHPCIYFLRTWLPLSKKNYSWWKRHHNIPDTDKTKRLEEILLSQLCEFFYCTGSYIPRNKIKISILDKDRLEKISWDGIGQVAFNIRYCINLELPPFIGLGNHKAFGFGWQRLDNP